MPSFVGAFTHPSATAIHSASFVLQDYVPAAIVGFVVLAFGAAIVVVSLRRNDVN